MKKFYLFALIMFIGFEMSAHGLTFYLGDKKIEPNSTVYFNDIKIEDTGEGVDYTMAPEIFLLSEETTSNVSIKASCTSGQRIQLCAGGMCETGASVEKSNVSLQAGMKMNIQFECMGFTFSNDEKVPVVTTEIVAKCGKDNEEVKFTIIMNSPESSIDNIIAEDALCDVFTITGVRMAHGVTVSEVNDNLPRGIYILRFTNGKSRKIVVR